MVRAWRGSIRRSNEDVDTQEGAIARAQAEVETVRRPLPGQWNERSPVRSRTRRNIPKESVQVAPEAIASVASFTPAPMLQSASRLVSSDALFPLHSRRSDEGLELEFTIQDGKALHQAEVFIRDSGDLDGWCSCGSLTLCVHTTAGVLFALTVTEPPAPRPAWQKELDEALPTDRETATRL
jgi:hypothetical protein